jgi:hypothetical protein
MHDLHRARRNCVFYRVSVYFVDLQRQIQCRMANNVNEGFHDAVLAGRPVPDNENNHLKLQTVSRNSQ